MWHNGRPYKKDRSLIQIRPARTRLGACQDRKYGDLCLREQSRRPRVGGSHISFFPSLGLCDAMHRGLLYLPAPAVLLTFQLLAKQVEGLRKTKRRGKRSDCFSGVVLSAEQFAGCAIVNQSGHQRAGQYGLDGIGGFRAAQICSQPAGVKQVHQHAGIL